MKAVVVLVLLLALVAGIAVSGSRAQPLAAISTAFGHCQSANTCQVLLGELLSQVEAELAAVDDAGGFAGSDRANVEIGDSRVLATSIDVANVVARLLLDLFIRFGGSKRFGPTIVPETAFDATR